MPFGLIFAALFFGGLCTWMGLGLVLRPGVSLRLTGVCLALFGVSVAVALVRRRPWARWTGFAAALFLVVVGLQLLAHRSGLFDHLLLFSAALTALLLALPATGDSGGPRPVRSRSGALEAVALISLSGLVLGGFWAVPLDEPTVEAPAATGGAVPLSSVLRRVQWSDYGTALERARAEKKPVLATFVTDWCPYCSKMSSSTWRDPAVLDRLGAVVPAKVNAEETQPRTGHVGLELARRYRVQGYPAQLLLDHTGRVLARADGYQTPTQMLSWLDGALRRSARDNVTPVGKREAR